MNWGIPCLGAPIFDQPILSVWTWCNSQCLCPKTLDEVTSTCCEDRMMWSCTTKLVCTHGVFPRAIAVEVCNKHHEHTCTYNFTHTVRRRRADEILINVHVSPTGGVQKHTCHHVSNSWNEQSSPNKVSQIRLQEILNVFFAVTPLERHNCDFPCEGFRPNISNFTVLCSSATCWETQPLRFQGSASTITHTHLEPSTGLIFCRYHLPMITQLHPNISLCTGLSGSEYDEVSCSRDKRDIPNTPNTHAMQSLCLTLTINNRLDLNIAEAEAKTYMWSVHGTLHQHPLEEGQQLSKCSGAGWRRCSVLNMPWDHARRVTHATSGASTIYSEY